MILSGHPSWVKDKQKLPIHADMQSDGALFMFIIEDERLLLVLSGFCL